MGLARLLLLLLALALPALLAPPAPAQDAPPGCEAVFAATTRGGADPSAPGGGGFLACARPPGPGLVRVVRVVDGDTIVIEGGERVRYVSVDAPEATRVVEPFGPEATAFNRRLVEGRWVRLERDVSDRDRYGRLLRYVWVGEVLVEAELVREGFAEAKAYPPDLRYYACLEALEEEARREGRGMWARR